ncbi:MAG: chemotaxis protein CheW [Desulfobulbaceae bacterium]|nr:chemotaxis protein CheW [Desulfobulbaceae bacterium]
MGVNQEDKLQIPDERCNANDTGKVKYLTFHLAGEDYGMDIAFVTEIIGMRQIIEVPGLPDFIKGVIDLRGKVIPVMDVRTDCNRPETAYDERTCIIIVDINSKAVGLVADQINVVADIPPKMWNRNPKSSRANRFLAKQNGINERQGEDLARIDKRKDDDEKTQAEPSTRR